MTSKKSKFRKYFFSFIFFFGALALLSWTSGCYAGVISDAPRISTVLRNALQFLLMIFGSVAIIGLVISGILYLTAGGNEKMLRQAKKSFAYSIVGIAIALSGLIIVRFVAGALGLY